MKLFKTLVLTLGLTAGALAASTTGSANTTTSKIGDFWDKLKKSPLSVSYLNDTYMDSKGANGLISDHLFYLNYKVDKYHKITLKPTLTTTYKGAQKTQGDYHTEAGSTELRFTRSSILKEDKHGVNMSFLFRNYFANDNRREASKYDTYHYLYFSLSKSFGKLRLSSTPYVLIYNRNSGSSISKRTYSLSLTPTYNITDSIYVSSGMIYYNGHRNEDAALAAGKTSTYHALRYVPEVGWSKGALSLSLYLDTYVAQSSDNYGTGIHQWWKKGSVGTNLYYTFF